MYNPQLPVQHNFQVVFSNSHIDNIDSFYAYANMIFVSLPEQLVQCASFVVDNEQAMHLFNKCQKRLQHINVLSHVLF